MFVMLGGALVAVPAYFVISERGDDPAATREGESRERPRRERWPLLRLR